MFENISGRIIVILLAITAAAYYISPPSEKIPLGLDLRGGVHIEAKIDLSELETRLAKDLSATEKESYAGLSAAEKESHINQAIMVIRNRINQKGTEEAEIRKGGKDRIVLQIPGYADVASAESLLTRVGYLEFALVHEDPEQLNIALNRKKTIPGYRILPKKEEAGVKEPQYLLVRDKSEFDGSYLKTANWNYNQQQMEYEVQLGFTSKGSKIFAAVTRKNVGQRLAIILDGIIYSAPNIRQEILGGQAQITGSFTEVEAMDLSSILSAGALPAKINVLQSRLISASLGKDSIEKGTQAAVFGLIVIAIFMLIYYLKAGVIANIALLLNIFLILGAIASFSVTLTLPGIAGLILTMGMAVDANVLIFERIREEIRSGKRVKNAVEAGFDRAFKTIIDANVTTAITSLILYKLGSGPIKGFAAVLLIGILVSMFTALFVTRTVFMVMLQGRLMESLKMFQIIKPTQIKFLEKRRGAYIISGIIILASVVGFVGKGDAKFGIDFRGGSVLEIMFPEDVAIDDLRTTLKTSGIDASLQTFGSDRQILIRTQSGYRDQILASLKDAGYENLEMLRQEDVGPLVGKELKWSSFWAILFSLIGIIAYIWVRFEGRYSIAAVAALVHDVIITAGIYSLLGYEMNVPTIAALLTIVGYSLNDTIVIFDRIRESLGIRSRKTEMELINEAINITLSRTLLTSLTTLLVVVSILVYGGGIIHDFAVTLFIGILVGTYSSIFVASPVLIELKQRMPHKD